MTALASAVAHAVAGYAARLHAAIGARHHVASPLGAWLLLALAGPASSGADRETLTQVLGCDVETAAQAAASLLAAPHPLVASAAAVWTAHRFDGTSTFRHWLSGLPAAVTTGDLPDQAGLDAWARERTFGLIESFPVDSTEAYLVLASALATKVSWQVPFRVEPATTLGPASPWASELNCVLRTPTGPGTGGHVQFIADTPDAGEVIVHMASAAGGLVVVSVAAPPEVAAGRVLVAAHDLGRRLATRARVERRNLASLPLGEGPLWSIREVMAAADSCTAVLPAWSASSRHDLSDPALGFAAAKRGLIAGPGPWQARQAAMARYTRTGFEAATVTAAAILAAAQIPARHREAELRFGHPYAVVALTTDPADDGRRPQQYISPWHGLPVFSAWISQPEDAADGEPEDAAGGESGRQV